MIGDGGVGKSSLAMRFVYDMYVEDYDPTIEDSYVKEISLNSEHNQNVVLNILDTAGQSEYNLMKGSWYREGDMFLLCYCKRF